ncbi:MAG: uroporphyrinogen decarboxylase family protein [Clostridioides sp.]|jgi:uroporphyrinogen decarboxylase|nr:uroporphyrinogen decarboxylase family protein [Clostridioides sp.]
MNDIYTIHKDEMTPRERMIAYATGKDIDRIPCNPFLGECLAPIFGHTVREYHHNPDILVDVNIKGFEKFRGDSVAIGPGLSGIPEAMGSHLVYPENSTPIVKSGAIVDYSELSKLEPIDMRNAGRVTNCIESLKKLQEAIGKEVFVGTSVGGPFTAAAFLRGTDIFLRDLTKHREEVHKLLEIATQSVLNYIDAACDLGIAPSLAEPTASGTLISAKNFEEFAQPYIKRCADRIRERTGSGLTIHICGKSKKIWGNMIAAGATSISLDNAEDINDLKEAYGDKVTIVGNIDPVNVIYLGEVEDIYNAAEQCIIKGKDNPRGHILASGCAVPIGTKAENIQAVVDAARIFGSTKNI